MPAAAEPGTAGLFAPARLRVRRVLLSAAPRRKAPRILCSSASPARRSSPSRSRTTNPPRRRRSRAPCEIAGQFFPAGDVDCFTFDAKKGDVFWIEVFSQRLGLPTNPFLLVQRDGGERAGGLRRRYQHRRPAFQHRQQRSRDAARGEGGRRVSRAGARSFRRREQRSAQRLSPLDPQGVARFPTRRRRRTPAEKRR